MKYVEVSFGAGKLVMFMQDKSEMLENGNIYRVLIKLSVPGTVAMMVNAMYNIVDTIFVGRGVGPEGIAAVAVYLPVQLLIFAFAQMTGVGAASYMSRSMGARQMERVNYIVCNSFFYTLVMGFVFMILGLLFTESILSCFGASNTIMPFAIQYARLMFIGSLYYPICTSSNHLMRAEGNAKDAMICMIMGFGINIILDYLFIFPLNMGIKGAALATVLAKLCSFFYLAVYLHSSRTIINLRPRYFKVQKDVFRETFSIGSSSFVIGGARAMVCVISNHLLGFYGGDMAIAIYGVVYKVIMFLGMPVSGIMQGMRPLIGYNFGARKYDRVIKTVRLGLFLSVLIAGTGTLLAELVPASVMSLFSNNHELINSGTSVLRITLLMVPFVGIQMTGTTLFQSLGRVRPSLLMAVLRQGLLFIPLVFILPHLFQNSMLGIWLAFPLSDLVSILIIIPIIHKEIKILKHLRDKKTGIMKTV